MIERDTCLHLNAWCSEHYFDALVRLVGYKTMEM